MSVKPEEADQVFDPATMNFDLIEGPLGDGKDLTLSVRPVNALPDFHHPVDIIVPFHGHYEQMTKLLESIFHWTRSNYYKVCVVDDCSVNPDYIKHIAKNAYRNAQRRRGENVVKAIRCGVQKGFAGACKFGFENTTSPYVCFLNSDCLIEDPN